MRKLLLLIAVLIQVNLSAYDYKLTPKKVTNDVWCFFGALEGPSKKNAGNMVNTCYIKTEDSYVVVDSGPSYQYAKQSYEAMSKIDKLPVKIVVATHDHDDHWLGNSYYKAKFNAKLLGPNTINSNYKSGQETRMFRVLPKDAIQKTKILKLDEVIDSVKKLSVGGVDFELIPIQTKAHTDDDLFVYIPKKKIIFAGDLVMNGRITSNRHGSLLGELKAIEMIKSKEWSTLVAGHGFKTGKDAITEADQYFTLMHKRIKKALEDEVELTEITDIVKMQEFKDQAMFDDLNARNVSEAFTELEFVED